MSKFGKYLIKRFLILAFYLALLLVVLMFVLISLMMYIQFSINVWETEFLTFWLILSAKTIIPFLVIPISLMMVVFEAIGIKTTAKKLGMSIRELTDFGPVQCSECTVNGDIQIVFKKCKSTINDIKAHIVFENVDEGVIVAKTKYSWKSYGEKLMIKLDHEANGVKIKITSLPKIHTSFMDLGKGYYNVTRFTQLIEKS